MILQFDDGRELSLPDEMTDESARQLKRLIQAHEERTKIAESQVRLLQDEMAGLRNSIPPVQPIQQSPVDTTPSLQAIAATLRRIEQAIMADREMVPNEFGDMVRSRVMV